ncbi:hypothetical protein LP316_12630 [Thalassotalea sp. LPB0316]|uniref:hypothetical protein n=1 Tax=Thalassotalea sp. LPB0316 TaxID=2769490 RepID=UPI001868929A|nr:hypothetical protein [Thalassotalea sp. LPB0316]QOL25140.1 hypothetical protein LP316_12630 [Thalassotalea sp. LPB0316]
MEIVELLKFILIFYAIIGLPLALLARHSGYLLSKVSGICSTYSNNEWTNYLLTKAYLNSSNHAERYLGLLHHTSGKGLKLILISIPYATVLLSAYIVYWLATQ